MSPPPIFFAVYVQSCNAEDIYKKLLEMLTAYFQLHFQTLLRALLLR